MQFEEKSKRNEAKIILDLYILHDIFDSIRPSFVAHVKKQCLLCSQLTFILKDKIKQSKEDIDNGDLGEVCKIQKRIHFTVWVIGKFSAFQECSVKSNLL